MKMWLRVIGVTLFCLVYLVEEGYTLPNGIRITHDEDQLGPTYFDNSLPELTFHQLGTSPPVRRKVVNRRDKKRDRGIDTEEEELLARILAHEEHSWKHIRPSSNKHYIDKPSRDKLCENELRDLLRLLFNDPPKEKPSPPKIEEGENLIRKILSNNEGDINPSFAKLLEKQKPPSQNPPAPSKLDDLEKLLHQIMSNIDNLKNNLAKKEDAPTQNPPEENPPEENPPEQNPPAPSKLDDLEKLLQQIMSNIDNLKNNLAKKEDAPTQNPPEENPPATSKLDDLEKLLQQIISNIDNLKTNLAKKEDPPAQNPPAQNPPAQNPPAQNPPAQNPPAQNPPAQNPPAQNPPAQNPPAQNPPAQNPPAQNPPAQNPPAQNPPAQNPPAQNPPAQNPPAQNPPAQNPPAQNSEAQSKLDDVEKLLQQIMSNIDSLKANLAKKE